MKKLLEEKDFEDFRKFCDDNSGHVQGSYYLAFLKNKKIQKKLVY